MQARTERRSCSSALMWRAGAPSCVRTVLFSQGMLMRAMVVFLSRGNRFRDSAELIFVFLGFHQFVHSYESGFMSGGFRPDLPGDFFHLHVAWQPPVLIVCALHDFEGNANRIIQAGA